MGMRTLVLGLGALLIGTTGAAAAGFQRYERVIAEVEAQNVRPMLDRRLRDLPSTRFQAVFASITTLKDPNFGTDYAAYAICGQINTKNAMGGYIGWQEFAVVRDNGPVGTPTVYLEYALGDAILLMHYCHPNDGLNPRFDQNAAYTSIVAGKTKVAN
jgi:hypothetical protein